MSTGIGPYVGTNASDTDDTGIGSPVIETTLVVSQATVDIGGVLAHAEVFNGAIPGPTFRLTVGDSVVVRLINDLPYPVGIHWHGIELENYSDGTEITQSGIPPAPLQVLGNGAPAGGTFLYKFKVSRSGLFWYHPHHGMSINRVFRGLYGMIIVTDPLESNLTGPGGVLPAAADTMQLVLSDVTVCKAPGTNDAATYVDPTTIATVADRPEWLSGLTSQVGPTPVMFCELPTATNDDGTMAAVSYAAGDVPSLGMMGPGRMTEGQTVLTNGVNVGGRLGTPAAPRALLPAAVAKNIQSGQGLRLQIVNCTHLRYFRLRLTTEAGVKVNLVRIGGEGGLLDNAILEGGLIGTIDTRFESGEIVLPPACRADVVAAIPAGLPLNSVLTLWTRDYQRTGDNNPGNWAQLPTVPVMHLKVTGAAGAAYTISAGDALRAPAGMPPVATLGAATGSLLNPVTIGKLGLANQDIKFQTGGVPNIDGAAVPAAFMGSTPYTLAPHLGSTRYAEKGKLLELTVTNASSGHAHHPFHLHGFSLQPVKFAPRAGAPGTVTGTFTWPYREFRDTIDLFPDYTLTFRILLTDRELADGVTLGGFLGRWLFHCHIFFHHMQGMISELVVTDASGKEKPNVNVDGSWAYAPIGGTAIRNGTFYHRDGLNMTLTTSKGTIIPNVASPGGNWSWSYSSAPGDPASVEYVYIKATDTAGRLDQAVFRLQIGGADAGSDIGDPHIRTVDGKSYDFQAAGEFTLLRDREGMEIQTRQTPVETPPPIKDNYTGLTECVSLNTAVAARVGSHRISYQPFREPGQLQFFVDGKPAELPKGGIDLEGDRVSTFDAGGETGLRVDYAHGPVLLVTPRFWNSYGLWYLDVDVSNTNGDEGLMGSIHKGTWLPNLPSGATVGSMPASLHERYIALYRTFADAWRVTDQTSMFVYTPWKSTATFTDRDWPPQKPPCTGLKPGFQKPVTPIRENIPIATAERICKGVTMKDLHDNCVFDVATTGDETLAKGYLIAQDLRRRGTAVQIIGDKPQTRPGEPLTVTATVLPKTSEKWSPAGTIRFVIDGAPMKESVKIDARGRAKATVTALKAGEHKIRADYTPARGDNAYYPSSSPNLLHRVASGRGSKPRTKGPGSKPGTKGPGSRPTAKGRGSTSKRGSKAGRRSGHGKSGR